MPAVPELLVPATRPAHDRQTTPGVQRRGQVVTRGELLEEVWGYSGEVYSRTVDTHVAELRRKLEENAAEPQHILTVRKTGYRIQG